jgi:hypothetical protein
MDVGAILSRSLNLYRRNPNLILPHLIEYMLDLLLIFIFAIFGAIILLLIVGSLTVGSVMSLLQGPTPILLISLVILAIVTFFFVALLLNAFARAAVIGMVVEANKDGKTSLGTGIESAKRHGLTIFGYTVAISVIPVVLIGAIVFTGVMAAVFLGEMGGHGTGLLSIAFIIFLVLSVLLAYVIIYVLALFSPQKIVIEGCGVIDGIKASFGFVRKYPTEVVIYIGVAAAVIVATSLASMIFAIPSIVFENIDHFIAVFFTIIDNIVSIALGLLVAPYLKAVKTLLVLEEGGEKSEVERAGVL